MKRRRSLAAILEESKDWPKAAFQHLPKDRQDIYKRNRDAVVAIRDSSSTVAEAAKAHKMSRDEIYRIVDRAATKHPDGALWGWRAFVPYSAVGTYTREKELPSSGKFGYAGAFGALLAKYPTLVSWIETNFFRSGPDGSLVRKTSVKKLNRAFLTEVRKLYKEDGLDPANHYPLNKRHSGGRSLAEYVRKMAETKLAKHALADTPEIAALLNRRMVEGQQLVATRPYEIVQADGHELKLAVKLKIKRPDGTKVELIVPRLWLIVFMDVYSRAILGYTVVPYENYNASDVLTGAAAALYGTPDRFPRMEGSEYPGKSLPVDFEPKLAGACWDILSFDNAMAHLAAAVGAKMIDVVNCAICRGMPGVPEFRAYIERAFKRIQEDGGLAHLAASRYGGRDVNPKQAINLEFLLPLIDAVIWEYNFETVTEANYGRTPYEALLEARDDLLLRKVGADCWGRAHFTTRQVTKTVRGNVKEGHPPYVEFHGARYSGKVLLERPDLIGKRVIFEYDEDDVLWGRIYTEKGHELGRVKAGGSRWGRRPHSLRLRLHIIQMIEDRLLKVPEGQDAISAWEQFVQNSGKPLPTRARAAATERKMRAAPEPESSSAPGKPKPRPAAPVLPTTFVSVASTRKGYKIG